MVEGGVSFTDFYYKSMTPEIIAGHQEEAREFFEEHKNANVQQLVSMHNEGEDWVCTILMYASILNDTKTFRATMECWKYPWCWCMADYCDYYQLESTSMKPDGSRQCVFRLWKHGGGAEVMCTIRNGLEEQKWII